MSFEYRKKNILGNYFLNPFILNALSFLVALLFFEMKWSKSYQNIDILLVFFLLTFILGNILLGVVFSRLTVIRFIYVDDKLCLTLLCLFTIGLLFDFIYSGNVAIINLLSSEGVFYKEINHLPFGIYVAVLGLGATLQIQYFVKYVLEYNVKYLFFSLICFLLLATSGTRSILVLCIVSCLLIKLCFMSSKKVFDILKLGVFVSIAIFLFSEVGNIRSNNYKNETYMKVNNIDVGSILLHKGHATSQFTESRIPKELFWIYAYVASPVANLNSILKEQNPPQDFDRFFVSNFSPDFVVKLAGYKTDKDKSSFLIDAFNAYTLFGLPAYSWGYLGMIITFFMITIFLFLILFFSSIVRNNIIILAILACVSSFSMFANMYQSDIFFFVVLFSFLISLFAKNARYNVCDSEEMKNLNCQK